MIHWNREKPREDAGCFRLGPHLPHPNSAQQNQVLFESGSPIHLTGLILAYLGTSSLTLSGTSNGNKTERGWVFFSKWVLWFHRCLPHEFFISIVEFASIRSWQLNKIGLFFVSFWGVTWQVQTHGISTSRSGSFRTLTVLATAWLWNSYLKIISIKNNIIFQCSYTIYQETHLYRNTHDQAGSSGSNLLS